ncbi:MAG: molecular chaperone DnaJ, partial [Candidatus Levybacteria bacterium CG_4_10_14_0_2_um_filter_35_8]
MMDKDYYKILGVGKTATQDEIKRAYRKLAVQFHPDKNKTKDGEQRFKEVSKAYEALSDPQKRQAYDQFGAAAFEQGAGGGQGPFGGGNPFGGAQG